MVTFLDFVIEKDKHSVEIDPKYDDINFVRTHKTKINQIKRLHPDM